MCGISGVVGLKNVTDMLFEGILSLEYRGYDSCGVALVDKKKLLIKKDIGGVEEFFRKERVLSHKSKIGLAHTRWATHGKVLRKNTHPFTSTDKKFAVVHNGIISNYRALRDQLEKEGVCFVSETDSEVVPHLLEKFYKATGSVEEALLKTLNLLEGAFAVAFITEHEPDTIFCAKRESPLMLGIGDEFKFVGSDFNAFIEYTRNAVILEDGEYAILTRDAYVIKNFLTRAESAKTITKIEWDSDTSRKGGYPHYMLKEIYEQPQTISNALESLDAPLDAVTELIADSKRVYLVGVGSTFYVAKYGKYVFSNYAGEFFPTISSDEFSGLATVDKNCLVFAVSQSGETYDTLQALKFAKAQKGKTAAIVNVMGSAISRMVDRLILQGSGPEISVISTKAALTQMTIMNLLALRLGLKNKHITKKQYNASLRSLAELPEIIQSILNERSGFIHRIANRYSQAKHWLYLGRGVYYPIALESALKMKEVAYVHAEGMPGGFLKHGTLALIDDDIFSIAFVPPKSDSSLYVSTMHCVEEVRARSGFVLGIHFDERGKNKDLFSEELILPPVPPILAPLIHLVIGQLFAYFTATSLKCNVDRPRFLAKSVTVG
ncbi:MAG: glutamine--fructose-6-phosphate transaminase (isomerizing) [Candidatus Nitrohelix vancouverensis]|uniref:Glutamine--fructose-6-phosphate aminotransferase [isomerizing] n=1 Tax=Candidatus Nitrohelix vancouverensis TaxID=2705534 RepID=A0A7T0C4H5_9BACT|nr:MAG: glutamine--fructose-6-phosphate transaminase (isomerizing) [Candidatus Nitrohelix vancouverensis]